ncbi:MAG: protein-S-isoprenylcysteine O-methyltransferase Ste14 [Sulfurimonas sp.]|jgi:protein-S-isoprenylcysteine O-methyltransferase Ste14|uniref:methyltransferase family protein n=1 Tax=Sulfurimonas sp. TaxID=2022749 RepID=UPI0039E3EAA2
MKKYLIFLYAVLGYILSIGSLSFLILWIYPWEFIKFTINNPIITLDINPIFLNTSLLLLFALQHSIMARSFFKDKLLKNISNGVKSANYSLASSICLIIMFYFWQPIEGVLWDFQSDVVFWSITIVYIVGWITAFLATFIIHHFELFGLYQGYRVLRNIPEPEVKFQVNYFYKYVRHPIQSGTLVGLWATPYMSHTHLFLSMGMTIYVLIGLHYEEKSLINTFGDKYKKYIDTTPMLLPFALRR